MRVYLVVERLEMEFDWAVYNEAGYVGQVIKVIKL